ncbi:hypothetical protein E2C01_040926 [Portunus trituberculatus]|uniref:Uncharacterized protein n=1 Tax=Portunus trituberculatus TaxID=210409 RepID=A0A5B7FPJ1_PORTR|nr:hypothetical protein [Portunus trituberculatus]
MSITSLPSPPLSSSPPIIGDGGGVHEFGRCLWRQHSISDDVLATVISANDASSERNNNNSSVHKAIIPRTNIPLPSSPTAPHHHQQKERKRKRREIIKEYGKKELIGMTWSLSGYVRGMSGYFDSRGGAGWDEAGRYGGGDALV